MTLKNEELLSRYFERNMTSGEEQNFLISVAANDELRLAFRSQLELMRAVSNDKDGIRSAAEVRMRTLAALGLSTLAADEFLEHELLSRPAKQVASDAVELEVASQASVAPSGFMDFIKSPVMTVVGGLAVGFMAAVTIFSSPEPEVSTPAKQGVQQQVVAPQTSTPSNQHSPFEQTPQTTANTPVLSQKASNSARQNISAARKPEGETITPNSGLNSKANGTVEKMERPVVVDRQGSGSLMVQPPKIKKPSDTTK